MAQPLVVKDTEKTVLDVKIIGDRVVFVETDGNLTIAARLERLTVGTSLRALAPPIPGKPRRGRRSNADKLADALATKRPTVAREKTAVVEKTEDPAEDQAAA